MILIVEQDESLATAMGELLFQDGFEICIADSVNTAVTRIDPGQCQGMVIDADGFPFYSDGKTMRLLGDWLQSCESPPPLIMLSLCGPSYSDQGLPPRSMSRALWVEWVSKPVQNKEFLSLIRQTVRPN